MTSELKILDVNCGIGDAIPYTTVVEYLGRKGKRFVIRQNPLHNNIKYVGQGAVLFKNNPYVESEVIRTDEKIHPQPKIIHGHIIEDVCYGFGVFPTRPLSGYLYCNKEEREWLYSIVNIDDYPKIIMMHAGGSTFPSAGTYCAYQLWVDLANLFESKGFKILLLPNGLHQSHEPAKIPCHFDFSDVRDVRKLITLVDAGTKFIGNDSGPVHIARCFNKKSIVTWSVPHKIGVALGGQHGVQKIDPAYVSGELVSAISSFARYSYPENENVLIWNENDERIFGVIARKAGELYGF